MLYLIVTVVADVVGVLLLGTAQGWTHPPLLMGGVAAMVVSFVAFSFATRTISISIANAVWAGASLVLVIVLGRVLLHDKLAFGQYVCLTLIIMGATGLGLLTKSQA